MSQLGSEHTNDANGTRKTLIILVIAIVSVVIVFMLYSHLPRANSADGTSSDLVTPVPQMTNPVSSVMLNRIVTVGGLKITILQAQQAAGFTDVSKQTSPYTVRIYMETQNNGQQPLGIDFPTRARLLLPNGKVVAPKLISVSPVTMPKATQVGYLDFPLQVKTQLAGMVLRFDGTTAVPFTAN